MFFLSLFVSYGYNSLVVRFFLTMMMMMTLVFVFVLLLPYSEVSGQGGDKTRNKIRLETVRELVS